MALNKYLFFFIFAGSLSFAQSIPQRDYTKVDSLAKTATYKGNLKLLVNDLTAAHESKFDKQERYLSGLLIT